MKETNIKLEQGIDGQDHLGHAVEVPPMELARRQIGDVMSIGPIRDMIRIKYERPQTG